MSGFYARAESQRFEKDKKSKNFKRNFEKSMKRNNYKLFQYQSISKQDSNPNKHFVSALQSATVNFS